MQFFNVFSPNTLKAFISLIIVDKVTLFLESLMYNCTEALSIAVDS